jgi:hypothetical protein
MNNKTYQIENLKLIMGPNSFCATQDKKDLIFNGVFFVLYFDPHQY